jgi:hypothetical protein
MNVSRFNNGLKEKSITQWISRLYIIMSVEQDGRQSRINYFSPYTVEYPPVSHISTNHILLAYFNFTSRSVDYILSKQCQHLPMGFFNNSINSLIKRSLVFLNV